MEGNRIQEDGFDLISNMPPEFLPGAHWPVDKLEGLYIRVMPLMPYVD